MATIGEIIKVSVFYSAANMSEAMNVFQFQLITADVTDAQLLAGISDWVEDVWHPSWDDFASNEVTIDGWEADVINLDGTVARNLGADSGLALAGAVISDNDAAAVSAYMQADTAFPKTRGRKFIPGVADTRIENGILNATTLAQLANTAVVYVSAHAIAGTTGNLDPGVVSTTTLTWRPFIFSIVVTDVPAYQRRRKPNVGS